MMILFLNLGVRKRSKDPYIRVSSFLTSAFFTSEITCFRYLASTSTPLLAAYFIKRLCASSRRLLATSQRGDSGIHLKKTNNTRFSLRNRLISPQSGPLIWISRRLGFARVSKASGEVAREYGVYGPKHKMHVKTSNSKFFTLVLLKLPKSEQHMPQKYHTHTHTLE